MNPNIITGSKKYQKAISLLEGSEYNLFLATYIRKNNPFTIFFWSYIIVGFFYALRLLWINEIFSLPLINWVIGIIGGLLVVLVISPFFHELLKAVYLKIKGNSTIEYYFHFQQMNFSVKANNFIQTKRSFYVMTLIPFLMLSVFPLILAPYVNNLWMLCFLSISFFHALHSLKDLAVSSYIYNYSDCYLYYPEQEDKTIVYIQNNSPQN